MGMSVCVWLALQFCQFRILFTTYNNGWSIWRLPPTLHFTFNKYAVSEFSRAYRKKTKKIPCKNMCTMCTHWQRIRFLFGREKNYKWLFHRKQNCLENVCLNWNMKNAWNENWNGGNSIKSLLKLLKEWIKWEKIRLEKCRWSVFAFL